ncbi:MAG: helix-turn-helix transcriptional regulator [Adlercreutzia sp.]|nr:helix-turn-helix transcriptional regulator [Adlercreutzia sp.]
MTKVSSIVRRAGELRDIPLVFLGLGFYRAWLDESLVIFSQTDTAFLSSKIVFDMTCGLTALALALFFAPRAQGQRSRMIALSAASMVLSSLGLALSFQGSAAIAALHTLCCVLAAFGMMTLSLLWIEFYASFNPVRMALCYALALLLGKGLTVLLAGYNDLYRFLFQLALPVFSGACLYRSRRRVYGAREQDGPSLLLATSFPWKPALFIGAYAFASVFSGFSVAQGEEGPLELVGALPAAAVFCSILLSTKRFDFFSMYGIALPLMVCGFLVLAVVPGAPTSVVSLCVSVSYSAASILVVLIVCGISYRTGASALRLFGLVRFAQYGAMALGMLCREMLDSLVDSAAADIAAFMVVIVFVVVVSAVFASERSSYFGWSVESIATQRGEKVVVPLTAKVEQVAEERTLTQREQEVLLQLLHRKTVASIAEDMFIAEGTVKAHIQHIYAKLDIHSRKELFSLFEGRE